MPVGFEFENDDGVDDDEVDTVPLALPRRQSL
jgi:hypothetical protein